jgi:glutathione synthase/RimK-type ligase-like ATP-grasp enzyme
VKGFTDLTAIKRLRKSMFFARMRQRFPMREPVSIDDQGHIEAAEEVRIDWPPNIAKPRVGIVKDLEHYPRWTKYRRFLETNGFAYDLCDIHAHDWIERARPFDIMVGLVSNEISRLEEIRIKYHFLETFMGKMCYPRPKHALLYENKCLEAYLSTLYDLPFAKTYIFHSREDAMASIANARFPLVSKINYSSGSMGVELVRTPRKARRLIRKIFSQTGRSTYAPWLRQKNYVYFQEYVPNDGYDIRVILVGNRAWGYYRRVLSGDFRASGMHQEEYRGLPEEAIRIAWKAQRHIRSPLLVVDMVRGPDGRFTIIEYSILCLIDTAEQLLVDGVPGSYIIDDTGDIRFERGHHWIHELALKKFLEDEYLPRISRTP